MDFSVKQFCWEQTGILPKYVVVDNIKKKIFPFNFMALSVRTYICVSKISKKVRYLHQYLASMCRLYSRIFEQLPSSFRY